MEKPETKEVQLISKPMKLKVIDRGRPRLQLNSSKTS